MCFVFFVLGFLVRSSYEADFSGFSADPDRRRGGAAGVDP